MLDHGGSDGGGLPCVLPIGGVKVCLWGGTYAVFIAPLKMRE